MPSVRPDGSKRAKRISSTSSRSDTPRCSPSEAVGHLHSLGRPSAGHAVPLLDGLVDRSGGAGPQSRTYAVRQLRAGRGGPAGGLRMAVRIRPSRNSRLGVAWVRAMAPCVGPRERTSTISTASSAGSAATRIHQPPSRCYGQFLTEPDPRRVSILDFKRGGAKELLPRVWQTDDNPGPCMFIEPMDFKGPEGVIPLAGGRANHVTGPFAFEIAGLK